MDFRLDNWQMERMGKCFMHRYFNFDLPFLTTFCFDNLESCNTSPMNLATDLGTIIMIIDRLRSDVVHALLTFDDV